jgi:ParB/RepB/Spo0J family partition protein
MNEKENKHEKFASTHSLKVNSEHENAWSKTPQLCFLKVEDVKVPEYRLQSTFSEEEADEFHASIGFDGVLQPIQVIEDSDGAYWLADGFHRLKAAEAHGIRLIPCIVKRGTVEDAIVGSATLNLKRGRIEPSDLAMFVKTLKEKWKWSEQRIADKLKLSKPYISRLLTIAAKPDVLEKLKHEEITLTQAYEMARGFLRKPKTENKASSVETASKIGDSLQPSTNEKLESTLNLKEVMEGKGRFTPLTPEDLKPQEPVKTKFMTCDFCGDILSRDDAKWIKVHSSEYDKVLVAIKKLAERESLNGSSQPER